MERTDTSPEVSNDEEETTQPDETAAQSGDDRQPHAALEHGGRSTRTGCWLAGDRRNPGRVGLRLYDRHGADGEWYAEPQQCGLLHVGGLRGCRRQRGDFG